MKSNAKDALSDIIAKSSLILLTLCQYVVIMESIKQELKEMLKKLLKVSAIALSVSVVAGCTGSGMSLNFEQPVTFYTPGGPKFEEIQLPLGMHGRWDTESTDTATGRNDRKTSFVIGSSRLTRVSHSTPSCSGTIRFHGRPAGTSSYYFVERLDNPSANCPAVVVIMIKEKKGSNGLPEYSYSRSNNKNATIAEKGSAFLSK